MVLVDIKGKDKHWYFAMIVQNYVLPLDIKTKNLKKKNDT